MNTLIQAYNFEITSTEYQKIAKLVYNRFGINLGEKKQSLVSNRLKKSILENGFNSFEAFYEHCLNDKSGNGLNVLINRISTNLTYFAREKEHFDFLKELVSDEFQKSESVRREKKIRVWCAGCSTGEEAYTMAMMLQSGLGSKIVEIAPAVLATDISERALNIAEKGVYLEDNVEKMDPDLVKHFFIKVGEDSYAVQDKIKKIVLYRRLNLMRPEFPFKNKFQAIFCRNVMIYFDAATRERLVEKFSKHLQPGGYLFIGHSESLGRANKYFRYIKPAVYQKVGA